MGVFFVSKFSYASCGAFHMFHVALFIFVLHLACSSMLTFVCSIKQFWGQFGC